MGQFRMCSLLITIAMLGFGCSNRTQVATPPSPALNLSGTWLRMGGSLVPTKEQGDIPLTTWAVEQMKAQRPANDDFNNTTDPSIRYADPDGFPRILTRPMKFKLIQNDDYIYQLWEYNQNWRQITMNKPHSQDPALTWYGEAVGKWEGDTLVVDSIGFRDSTWLDGVAHPHSADLHIVERIRRMGETLVIDFTFEDPKAYKKPWSSQLTFKLVPDGAMTEYISTISDELRFRERFLHQKPTIPIRH